MSLFFPAPAIQAYHHAQAVKRASALLRYASPLRVTRLARGDDAEGVGTRNVFKFRHACGASNKEHAERTDRGRINKKGLAVSFPTPPAPSPCTVIGVPACTVGEG